MIVPPTPGPQSYVVLLFLYPLLSYILFQRLPLRHAMVWTIALGYLLLPAAWVVNINLPLVPSLDKALMPALMASVLMYVALRKQAAQSRYMRGDAASAAAPEWILPGLLPRSTIGAVLVLSMFGGAFMTVMTNTDPQVFGPTVLPGQRPYDFFGISLTMLITLIPLLLGRKFLADTEGHRILLTVLCSSALIYTLPALYEVRMSPQINIMVYGFFQHDFAQHIRAGGFRPVVFLDHGLLLGIFLTCAVIGMATLTRLTTGLPRALYMIGIPFLVGVLFLSKTLGALIIIVLLLPIALLLPIRLQLIAAACVAAITLTYPLLRGAGLIPTAEIAQIAHAFDADRGRSLGFRLDNEDEILERASERPLFGWSGYGRWMIYDEETGRTFTVADGEWIIAIAQWGWVGYIAKFGLLCLPLILFAIRQKRYEIGLATAGMCLVIAANLIDLIPNSNPSPLIWMAAGALLGRLETRRDTVADPAETETAARPAMARTAVPAAAARLSAETGRYSRFPQQHRRRSS